MLKAFPKISYSRSLLASLFCSASLLLPLISLLAPAFIARAEAQESAGIVLRSFNEGELEITLRKLAGEQSQGYELRVSVAQSHPPLTAQVFALSEPSRIALDLAGIGGSGGKSIKLQESKVSGIRLGRYKDKIRLVLDFATASPPKFSILPKDSSRVFVVNLVFSSASNSSQTLASATVSSLSPPQLPALISVTGVVPSSTPSLVSSGTVSLATVSSGSSMAVSSMAVSSMAVSSMGLSSMGLSSVELSSVVTSSVVSSSVVSSLVISSSVSAAPLSRSSSSARSRSSLVESASLTTSSSSSRSSQVPSSASSSSLVSSNAESLAALAEEGSSAVNSSLIRAPGGRLASVTPPLAVGEKTLGDIQGAVVRGMQFRKVETKSPGSISIDLSTPVHYSLTRAQDNLYELVLEGARVAGSHLELPQFPPDYVEGIQMVTIKGRGGNVVVQIYVDEGAKLKPFTSQGQLWVSVSYQ